jgi:hypothetical protein
MEVGMGIVLDISTSLSEIIVTIWKSFVDELKFAITHIGFVVVPYIFWGLAPILFWAGFAPSLWLWLYVAALFVTRLLLRSERIVNWLRWALDIEKNPFRSIGAVAATLAFLGSVVIILVSAEISNISSALESE